MRYQANELGCTNEAKHEFFITGFIRVSWKLAIASQSGAPPDSDVWPEVERTENCNSATSTVRSLKYFSNISVTSKSVKRVLKIKVHITVFKNYSVLVTIFCLAVDVWRISLLSLTNDEMNESNKTNVHSVTAGRSRSSGGVTQVKMFMVVVWDHGRLSLSLSCFTLFNRCCCCAAVLTSPLQTWGCCHFTFQGFSRMVCDGIVLLAADVI